MSLLFGFMFRSNDNQDSLSLGFAKTVPIPMEISKKFNKVVLYTSLVLTVNSEHSIHQIYCFILFQRDTYHELVLGLVYLKSSITINTQTSGELMCVACNQLDKMSNTMCKNETSPYLIIGKVILLQLRCNLHLIYNL